MRPDKLKLNPESNPSSDHLILLGRGLSQDRSLGSTFFARDWSSAWVNFLLQEVGSYSLSFIEKFNFDKLKKYSFVYLPHSMVDKLYPIHQNLFKSYVESGGTLVVEGGAANSLDFIGVKFSSKKETLKSITCVQGGTWPRELADLLIRTPFETRGWEIESLSDDTHTILEMERTPTLLRRCLGRGSVVILGFDFGLLLTGLQQGTPVEGAYRLKKLFGHQHRVIEPEDLVLKASLLNNPVPWADLFERFLFKVITAERPAPRWWYFPGNYTGAVISTHDDEAIGLDPRLESMCQTEKSLGVRATYFVISDPKLHERWGGNGNLKRLNDEGAEVGLHWNRFQKPKLKLRSFKFGMHEEPLREQIQFLEKETGASIRINRTHYLALGSFYDEHFKKLAQEEIPFDSTYGPNQGGRGYLFGTGYPYYGLTWEGRISGVLELPFLTQELWGGADLAFIQRLIAESDKNFHQVVTMNFHPHYKVLYEEGREAWLGGLRFAKERGQWTPTVGEFFRFFEERSKSSLQSQWADGRLEVTTESQADTITLSFPSRTLEGKNLSKIEVDEIEKTPQHLVNGWFEESLVQIPRGPHKVRAVYA